MPWGIDYIDFCNMNRQEVQKWLRRKVWKYPDPTTKDHFKYRDDRKRFTESELENIHKAIQRFRVIVLKWVNNEDLSEEDKWHVIHRFVTPRTEGVSTPHIKSLHPINFCWRWPGAKLDDLEFVEIVTDSEVALIEFTLYKDLHDDIQAIKDGKSRKPLKCARNADPGTRQKACEKMFRPSGKPGRPQIYCSPACGSTVQTRKAGERGTLPHIFEIHT